MHPAARKRESPDPAQELWVWTSGTILRPDRNLIKLMKSIKTYSNLLKLTKLRRFGRLNLSVALFDGVHLGSTLSLRIRARIGTRFVYIWSCELGLRLAGVIFVPACRCDFRTGLPA